MIASLRKFPGDSASERIIIMKNRPVFDVITCLWLLWLTFWPTLCVTAGRAMICQCG